MIQVKEILIFSIVVFDVNQGSLSRVSKYFLVLLHDDCPAVWQKDSYMLAVEKYRQPVHSTYVLATSDWDW